ncbi:beta-sandwich domain-containing protein [Bdellovibrio svalbardensis]|uniref:Beta-sandwich domain-containing protein n=1 Tax=Bdellovibrio svalbardensis TaxID=2972972 RepID=A0ABT6DHU0_9BACT|nr:beta-sandwich domain-containing protein [Bdellovibrio svalbardensis]MDG0815810.1 beta-sandwich domain-containing protein [Bdellovibrio svalbardensis]
MDRHSMYKILTSVLLLQTAGIAHAYTISPSYQNVTEALAAPPVEPAPSFEGSARIGSITRQAGGDIYRLDLSRAIPLTQLKVKPQAGRVRIIETVLVTDKNERIPVKTLTNVTVAATDAALVSENLNPNAIIAVIEIKAEAMGGDATLDVKAVSSKEAPQLTLREELSCKQKIDPILKDGLDTVQKWASRVEGSAPGSIQEKYTIQEFNKYVNYFITTLKSGKPSYASTEYTLVLLNFFTERYNASREGSALELGYKTMATETFSSLLTSIQSDQPCRNVTSEGLINIALDFQKKYETVKSDSRAGKLYEMMITEIGKVIPAQYRRELATKNYDFRAADTEGNKYYKSYTTSKPESILKATQRDMSLAAYAVAEKALLQEVKQMDNEQRYQLIVEFQTKYNDPTHFHQETMMKYLLILSEQGTLFRIYISK